MFINGFNQTKFKNRCKVYNFEVYVEFEDKSIDEEVIDTILLMISDVRVYFKNNTKYIDLCINAYTDTNVEESIIPAIKTIKINRYDKNGNLLLTTIYNNCVFVCNEVNYINYTNQTRLGNLDVVYKFTYDNMLIKPFIGEIKNG